MLRSLHGKPVSGELQARGHVENSGSSRVAMGFKGSPVVPFFPFFYSVVSEVKRNSKKKGTLITIGLLRNLVFKAWDSKFRLWELLMLPAILV